MKDLTLQFLIIQFSAALYRSCIKWKCLGQNDVSYDVLYDNISILGT